MRFLSQRFYDILLEDVIGMELSMDGMKSLASKRIKNNYTVILISFVVIILMLNNAAMTSENKYYERPMTEWTADEIKSEGSLMLLIQQELSRLKEHSGLPFLKKEDLSYLKQSVFYRINGIVAESLCLENSIFCNVVKEMGTCRNRFSIEYSSRSDKIRYFFCLTDQKKIEFKAVYISDNNNWKKML